MLGKPSFLIQDSKDQSIDATILSLNVATCQYDDVREIAFRYY